MTTQKTTKKGLKSIIAKLLNDRELLYKYSEEVDDKLVELEFALHITVATALIIVTFLSLALFL